MFNKMEKHKTNITPIYITDWHQDEQLVGRFELKPNYNVRFQ